MLNAVRQHIATHTTLKPFSKIIVGLSGGADSIVMLDVLTLLGYDCVAAHCNFHLRGDESDADAHFVKTWCKRIDVPFTSIDFDTHQYAADKKISIEMAARELRYHWFEIVRKQYLADAIAVAHHKDDSVETVLLNLIRGTGIQGLTGISPQVGRIVRPMLCVTRQQIEAYATDRELPFVTDSTNADTAYTRNAIRHQIIPLMKTLNPSVTDAISRTAQNLHETDTMLRHLMTDIRQQAFDGTHIYIDALRKSVAPSVLLFDILSPLGFNSSTITDIAQSLDSEPGKVFHAPQWRLVKDRTTFLLTPQPTNDIPTTYLIESVEVGEDCPIKLSVVWHDNPVSIDKSPNKLYLDADKVSFPLTLRKWQQGDWFIPFGMTGRKKVSDFFTDQKFSLLDKEEAWLLTSSDDILWIVGKRSDNRFRLTPNTKSVIEITYYPNK